MYHFGKVVHFFRSFQPLWKKHANCPGANCGIKRKYLPALAPQKETCYIEIAPVQRVQHCAGAVKNTVAPDGIDRAVRSRQTARHLSSGLHLMTNQNRSD